MSQTKKGNVLLGRSNGEDGTFVFDSEGYCLGFIPKNYTDLKRDTVILSPDGIIALVILRDGTLQNPDGTPSQYTDPIQYLLDHVISRCDWVGQPVDSSGKSFADGTQQFVFQVAKLNIGQRLLPNDQGLFMLLGATLADIQSFETLIAGFLASLDLSNGRNTPQTNYDDLVANHYSKTLGTLVRLFRQHHINDIETADALDYAKNRRNFFAHSILRKYGWWEMSDVEYRLCVFEIFEIRSAINVAQDKLIGYLNNSNLMKVVSLEFDPITEEFAIRNHPN